MSETLCFCAAKQMKGGGYGFHAGSVCVKPTAGQCANIVCGWTCPSRPLLRCGGYPARVLITKTREQSSRAEKVECCHDRRGADAPRAGASKPERAGSIEEGGAEVPLAGVRQDGDDPLARSELLCETDGGGYV